ncbi:MAG TPA: hypothetical protein VFL57_17675 [Bryobacteraceae bacterium]|nr:hypothetical protein [Bryobacteraceae bacterium]
MAKNNYFVSVKPDAQITSVAGEVRAAGANVRQTLDAIGIVEVEADEALVEKLKSLAGVASVDPATGGFQLPPPDSPVQ